MKIREIERARIGECVARQARCRLSLRFERRSTPKKSVKEGQKMEGDDDDDDDGRRMKMRRRQKRFEPFNRYDQREKTFVYLYVFLFFFPSPFVPIEN